MGAVRGRRGEPVQAVRARSKKALLGELSEHIMADFNLGDEGRPYPPPGSTGAPDRAAPDATMGVTAPGAADRTRLVHALRRLRPPYGSCGSWTTIGTPQPFGHSLPRQVNAGYAPVTWAARYQSSPRVGLRPTAHPSDDPVGGELLWPTRPYPTRFVLPRWPNLPQGRTICWSRYITPR
jgi:hypothetical protein